MGKIKNFVQKLTFGDRTEDAVEIPKSGTGLFWFVLKNHWMRLILLNLLFCVCSIPVVTLPAAYGALIAVTMQWARRVPDVEPFRVYFAAWKPHFLAKTAVALLLCIAPASVAGYVYMFTANGAAFYALLFVFGLVSLAFQKISLGFGSFVFHYWWDGLFVPAATWGFCQNLS